MAMNGEKRLGECRNTKTLVASPLQLKQGNRNTYRVFNADYAQQATWGNYNVGRTNLRLIKLCRRTLVDQYLV